MFTSRGTSSITRRRSVRLSSIAEDSRLQPPVGVWAVRSPTGGGQALTSPSRRRLGELLPHQQADSPQAVPKAHCYFTLARPSRIIQSFDWLCPTLGYVPTCSYLVCHGFSYCYEAIRLACLIHAASVHPELGSNSN